MAKDVAGVLVEKFPHAMHSDQGPEFNSHLLKVCCQWKVNKTQAPWSNGMVEQRNIGEADAMAYVL